MKRFLNFKNDLAKHLAECRNLFIKIFCFGSTIP